MITFNNIVERFKLFAENHFFVETFSFGSPDDVDLTKFTNFPLMHLVYTGATYDAGTKTYNLEVYILDVPGDKTAKVDRQKEVVSDAEQCAEDIIADIKNGGNIFLFAQDYEVVNATTTPLEEETKNVLSGVLLDLSVAIPYEWDACNAPIDGVEPGGTEVTYARRGVLRMLTLDGATDVASVRTIKVPNGTLTDNGDGVVILDTAAAETLAGLTDVDVTGVTDGQVLKYDDATGEWIPANDQSATSLGNLDDVSLATPANREALIYDGDNWVNDNVTKADVGLGNVDNTSDADKPVSTATQTALDLKANTADVPTELNDLSDVSLTTPTGNQALIYNATASAFQALPSYTNRFEDEAEQAASDAVTGTGLFIERYYSAKADGDGIFIDAQSDTPASGKVIVRKIYQIQGGLNDTTVTGWTLLTTFADDTAYSATVSTFDGYRDGDTYGTPPFTLAQTWEEQTAAPAFTGLLNETYGSGAAAAYSVRRLNGNYTGAAIQVERSSDNTTQDIGFDSNGDLDESALTTFCSGTVCKVRSWYDQSQTGGTGSGNDAVQTTHANQPTIYTGGAIVKENGMPAVEFDGSDDGLTLSSLTYGNGLSLISLYNQTSGTRGRIWCDDITGQQGYWILFGEESSGDSQKVYINDGAGFDNWTHQTAPINQQNLLNIFFSSSQIVDSVNGTAQTQSVTGFSPPINLSGSSAGFAIGNSGNLTHATAMRGQEFILYHSDKSTDRTSIESNIGDYFTQNTPLLDTYSGAAAAYSLRLLDSTYSGSAIRVRRSSDNAEQDIGFNVFGELDTVSLASFCSGTDGFVKIWYSQAGTGVDATQTNTANQPKIYDGTTGVVTENGKPACDFNSTILDLSNFITPSTVSTYTVAGVARPDANDDGILILSDGSENMTWHYGRTAGELSVGTYDGATVSYASGSATISNQFLGFSTHNFDTPQSTLFINGNSTSGTNAGRGDFDSRIGGGPAGRDLLGVLQEIILWPSDQSSNRTNIESNINTFYSIY